MHPSGVLVAVRRRWHLVAACSLIAAIAGFLTAEVVGIPAAARPSYVSTTVLLNRGGLGQAGLGGLKTVAYLAKLPPVARIAARDPGVDASRQEIASAISTQLQSDKGLFSISASADSPRGAEALSDAYAKALLAYLERRRDAVARADIRRLQARIASVEEQGGPVATAAALLKQRMADAVLRLGAPTGLEVIQPGDGVRASSTFGIDPPASRAGRAAVAGIVGFMVGLVLVVVLDRYDTTLRSRRQVEETSALPVLAEIPPLPQADREVTAVTRDALSGSANAFRFLAASVVSQVRRANPELNGHGPAPAVVLVTSAQPREGRSTIAANLAASLVERGHRAMAVSCDLRRPALHRFFGLEDTGGLIRFATEPEVDLQDVAVRSQPSGVLVVPSGGEHDRPAELLASDRTREAFARAREMADLVIVDAPPVFGAGDALSLLSQVDAVVVVARTGTLAEGDLLRLRDLLRMVDAPVIGVVMNGAGGGVAWSRPAGRLQLGASR